MMHKQKQIELLKKQGDFNDVMSLWQMKNNSKFQISLQVSKSEPEVDVENTPKKDNESDP